MRERRSLAALEARIPPVVLLGLAGLLVWVVARVDLDGSSGGTAARALGAVLVVAGVAVAVAGVVEFRRAGTTVDPHRIDRASTLATSGIYRRTRNPMYLGMLVALAGWAALVGSVLGFAVGGLFLWAALTRLQIIPEERVLTERFGAAYGAYCARVRRWL